jgi:hypothetical protein
MMQGHSLVRPDEWGFCIPFFRTSPVSVCTPTEMWLPIHFLGTIKDRKEAAMMRTFWILLSLLLGAVNAHAQTPFYQGKTVTFIVGFPPAVTMIFGPVKSRSISQNISREIRT